MAELTETVNLEANQTGIEGIISIATRPTARAARVTYYAGRPANDQPSMSVTIARNPRVVQNNLPGNIATRMAPMVQAWVSSNHAKLLDFWSNGHTWYHDEVTAFIAGLVKYIHLETGKT